MEFEIQDKVRLIAPVSYLKTSDNMPMLRPPESIVSITAFLPPS